MGNGQRKYWVVSPNAKNDNRTVGEWRQASVTRRAAFMGWDPDDPEHSRMGPKFAGRVPDGIEPGDVILIARRYSGAPEVVGFGVVDGQAATTLPSFRPPDDDFGSLRRLRPFVPWSGPRADVPLAAAVKHTRALAQLHPGTNEAHREICDWMERHLQRSLGSGSRETTGRATSGRGDPRHDESESRAIAIVALPGNYQLDYDVRSRAGVRRAQREEHVSLTNTRGGSGSKIVSSSP
jgi:hypothetical protein